MRVHGCLKGAWCLRGWGLVSDFRKGEGLELVFKELVEVECRETEKVMV